MARWLHQSLRRATPADHRRVYKYDPAPGCIGFAVEAEGKLLALLIAVTRDQRDDEGQPAQRSWALLNMVPGVSPALLHRAAKQLIEALAAAGRRCVYAFSDAFRPDGDMWLRRLGFAIDLSVAGPNSYPVFRCDFTA